MSFGDAPEKDMYVYHEECNTLLWYPEILKLSGRGLGGEGEPGLISAIKITGYIEAGDKFVYSPWYTYEVSKGNQTLKLDGEYSVKVYDAKGKQVSMAYFDPSDNYQEATEKGTVFGEREYLQIPVNVTVRFPDTAAKIVIYRGDKELYSRNAYKSAPTVAFTGLTEGQELPNQTTLTWEATGGDGLSYEVWYKAPVELTIKDSYDWKTIHGTQNPL
jgi:hypothetical protein